MSKIHLVPDQDKNLDQDIDHQDIKINLEALLECAKTESCYLEIIAKINSLLQNQSISENRKNELKNLRQKAYDRKKKLQILMNEQTQKPILNSYTKAQSRTHQNSSILTNLRQDLHQDVKKQNFLDQDLDKGHQEIFSPIKIFNNLDVELVLKKIPAFIVFTSCALTTLWFVWWQSIPLYESTGFSDPRLSAFGALLMISGFSVIHAMTRSKIVLLLCLFASGYEVALIVDGTVKNETHISTQAMNQNPEVLWLKQQVEYTSQSYQTVKTQYDNPSSKVFQNTWYKEKFVDSAWKKYSIAQENLSKKMTSLSSDSSSRDHKGILKILYRLGLVFLCMVSIHHLLKLFQLDHRKSTSNLCQNKTTMAYQ